jgi:hypothetical protein
MGKFERKFDAFNLDKFKEAEIYKLLERDIKSGEVFPALRVNRIDFYYKGGRIFWYKSGKFYYNTNYLKYMSEDYTSLDTKSYLTGRTVELKTFYEDLKKGIEKKFSSKNAEAMERKFLTTLYKKSFGSEDARTVVLDIEVRFNNGNGKKCDLLLYNNKLQKLMLVEAKVIGDSRLKSKDGTPEVVSQVNEYSSWFIEVDTFKEQYSNYIKFINKEFDTKLNKEIKDICKTAKLVVFEYKKELEKNHKEKLEIALGKKNVFFMKIIDIDQDIDIDELWNELNQ